MTDFTCLTSPGENWLGLHNRLHQEKIGWDRTSDLTRRLAGTTHQTSPGQDWLGPTSGLTQATWVTGASLGRVSLVYMYV